MKHLNKLFISENIGDTLESIRSEIQLTKKEFSILGKISPSYYSDIINNKKTPNLNSLEKFCENIGVPLHVLIFKAMNENQYESNDKKKLIREIKPYLDKITEILYKENYHDKIANIPNQDFLNCERNFSCENKQDYFEESNKRKVFDLFENH